MSRPENTLNSFKIGEKMKARKHISIIIVLTMLMISLVSCGSVATPDNYSTNNGSNNNSNIQNNITSNNNSDTITLKDFLNSGSRVGLINYSDPPEKDKYSDIVLFEDGKIYMVCPAIDENGKGISNYYHEKSDAMLTWGDVAKMTEKELLDFAESHKSLEWGPYDCSFKSGYTLHIYTDETGNNRKYESIEVEWVNQYGVQETNNNLENFDTPASATIYDRTFYGVKFANRVGPSSSLLFVTDDNIKIVLDEIGASGVLVD